VDSETNSGEKKNVVMGINAFIPIVSTSNTCTTSSSIVSTSNGKPRPQNPPGYGGKSIIITSETPLANEDLSKIVASITANPDVSNYNRYFCTSSILLFNINRISRKFRYVLAMVWPL